MPSCSRMAQLLTPDRNPNLWVGVNVVVFMYSGLLLWLVIAESHPALVKPLMGPPRFIPSDWADRSYLVYNVVTSILWVMELVLPSLAWGWRMLRDWGVSAELVLGVYFTVKEDDSRHRRRRRRCRHR